MSSTDPTPATGRTRHSAGKRAAGQAQDNNSLRITLPGLGQIRLPPPEQLAYFAGIAALTALEIIEWPIALTLAAGHLLADQRRNKILHDFGKALEDA
ncbi:MAG TPA: hypothetical protein VE196_04000 [Pseudonocardiaceae bacterium]|nr:hypothetical protein [Pseudonocardiaceae bacterium]